MVERWELEGMGLAGFGMGTGGKLGAGKRRRVRKEMFDRDILEIGSKQIEGRPTPILLFLRSSSSSIISSSVAGN